jgi:hypothetical protein
VASLGCDSIFLVRIRVVVGGGWVESIPLGFGLLSDSSLWFMYDWLSQYQSRCFLSFMVPQLY